MGHTNYSRGHEAEFHAAEHLKKLGYKIIELNWSTRLCEIDIVAQKKNTIYFVEVKYRSHTGQGTGLEYITPQKLKQMKFAAECWVQEKKWRKDYELAAIELQGENFTVTTFLESIS